MGAGRRFCNGIGVGGRAHEVLPITRNFLAFVLLLTSIQDGTYSAAVTGENSASGRVRRPSPPPRGDNGYHQPGETYGKRNFRTSRSSLIAHSTPIVYKLGNIMCRGTCDTVSRGARHHGGSSEAVVFEVCCGGKYMRVKVSTLIGSMAAHFVTFEPLKGIDGNNPVGDPLLTSASVPAGGSQSFNASCLDQQARDGSAASIWTFSDRRNLTGRLNAESNAYKSGRNYYHKFGGNHQDCDVYRLDPCRYAPMLTPPNVPFDGDGADSAIRWKLHIDGCEATWIGDVSIDHLLQMRNSENGRPLFTLLNGTVLFGTVYLQVVKPADWNSPAKGVTFGHKPYDVRLNLRSAVSATSVTTEGTEQGTAESKGLPPGGKSRYAVSSGGPQQPNPAWKRRRELRRDVLKSSVEVRFKSSVDVGSAGPLYQYNLLIRMRRHGRRGFIPSMALPRVVKMSVTNASLTVPVLCNDYARGLQARLNSDDSNDARRPCETKINFDEPRLVGMFKQRFTDSEFEEDVINVSTIGHVAGNSPMLFTSVTPQGSFALHLQFEDGSSSLVDVRQATYIGSLGPPIQTTSCRLPLQWQAAAATVQRPAAAVLRAKRALEESIRGRGKEGGECLVGVAQSYGLLDRVYVSLRALEVGDNLFPVRNFSLHRLTLSVDAARVLEVHRRDFSAGKMGEKLHFLLDGKADHNTSDEVWVDGKRLSSQMRYLDGEKYASFVRYRRGDIRSLLAHVDSLSSPSAATSSFSFVPGALLRRGVHEPVEFHLEATLKVLTNNSHVEIFHTERLHLIVDPPASTRLPIAVVPSSSEDDNSTDAYDDSFVRLPKEYAVVFYIVLSLAIVISVAVGLLMEWRFHRVINDLRQRLKEDDTSRNMGCQSKDNVGATERT